MVSDVPVGAFLSGGLDSSSIVAFGKEVNPKIECFTIDTRSSIKEGFVHDLPYAWQVAKHLKVPLNVVNVDEARFVKELPAMVANLMSLWPTPRH